MAAQTKPVCAVNKECKMKTDRFTRLSRLVLALGCTLAVTAGRAESGAALERIEVSGAALRSDLLRTCPQVAEDLQRGLQRDVALHGIGGSYLVQFELKGAQVGSFQMSRLPFEYRRALRSALRNLQCQDGAAQVQAQRFGFILDIVADDRWAPPAPGLAGAGGPALRVALRPAD